MQRGELDRLSGNVESIRLEGKILNLEVRRKVQE